MQFHWIIYYYIVYHDPDLKKDIFAIYIRMSYFRTVTLKLILNNVMYT